MDPEINRRSLFSTESPDCIFRASGLMRVGRESDFVPKSVSIGPYYHGRENLKLMDIKVQCMSDLLEERPVGGSNIDCVPVDQFKSLVSNARRFYKEKVDLSDDKFVEMLVLDSCFVIRIMLGISKEESMDSLNLNIKEAVSDFLLLENQIPLFFITKVFHWLFPVDDYIDKFSVLVQDTFSQLDSPWYIVFDGLPINSDHLLHLYWKISEASIKKKIKEEYYTHPLQPQTEKILGAKICGRTPQKLIGPATELQQMAGINFENVEIEGYDGGVEFSKGIMRIPYLNIDSSRKTFLVNLEAYENSMLPYYRTISTYMKLMDDLIDSDKDVELLQKSGVVYNRLSSHNDAAKFFNDIGNLCLIDYKNNPFSKLFEDVNKYYMSSWNRTWANLQQNYFNNPWVGISVFAVPNKPVIFWLEGDELKDEILREALFL